MVRTREMLINWKIGLASKAQERKHRIDAMCISCIYDEALAINWKKQVGDCTVTDCPLYPIRSKSSSESYMNESEV